MQPTKGSGPARERKWLSRLKLGLAASCTLARGTCEANADEHLGSRMTPRASGKLHHSEHVDAKLSRKLVSALVKLPRILDRSHSLPTPRGTETTP